MEKHCCHSPLSEEKARLLLTEKGLNKTKIKIKLLIEISRSIRPLSVQELHDLTRQACDVSTIFRTISQFKEKGLIKEVNLEEGFIRYEMAPVSTSKHHHHVRCRSCGDIKLIEKCDLAAFERAIGRLGFSEMEHRLEFTGVCSKCR